MNIINSHQIIKVDSKRVKANATINLNDRHYEVSYLVEGQDLYPGIEPFLTLALLPAMTTGQDIKLDEPVSGRLLENLSKIQEVFCNWDKRFHRITVTAPIKESRDNSKICVGKPFANERVSGSKLIYRLAAKLGGPVDKHRREVSGNKNKTLLNAAKPDTRVKTACFFSGGVDSFYTLLKHFSEIDTLLYVSAGFDLYPDPTNLELRKMICERLRQVAHSLGKEFIEIKAEVINFSDQFVGWHFFSGPAMGALAQLFAGQFGKIYIASSFPYSDLQPCGSSPLVDPLWSIEGLEIIHDGCEATRLEKISGIISSQVALDNLRVCQNYGESREYNCSNCSKCLRTRAALRALGVLDKSPAFTHSLDLQTLPGKLIDINYPYLFDQTRELWEKVKEIGTDPELAETLEKCLTFVNIDRQINQGLREQVKEYEHLFLAQRAWTRDLENGKVWLSQQLEETRKWGLETEKELVEARRLIQRLQNSAEDKEDKNEDAAKSN